MTREEEIIETAKLIYSPSSGIPQSLSMRVGFIEGAKWADKHPNLNKEDQVRMDELETIRQKKSLIKKVCNWLKSKISIDWNKLKKATINAASIFGDEDYINLNSDEFPEVTFDNSPQEVKLVSENISESIVNEFMNTLNFIYDKSEKCMVAKIYNADLTSLKNIIESKL